MTMTWLENQVASSTGIPHTMGNSLDLGGRAYGFVGGQTALRIDQVGGEDGVDQSRLSETSLAYLSV